MIKRKILPALIQELASDKVIVLTGMRRVGKTTLVRLLFDQVADKRKVYLDLENPLNQEYFAETDYEKIKLNLERLSTGRAHEMTVFLDEIQYVRHIPSVVKYLSDHFGVKFILTGSTSFYLKQLFSESLAGRKRLFELDPLDFEEFLAFRSPSSQKLSTSDPVTEPTVIFFDKYLEEYLIYGGFPSVVLKESHEEKIAEIDDIFTSYFQKEIRLFSDFRKIDTIRSTILLLAQRVGSKIDVSKMAAELATTRVTILEYLDYLEGTYFLSRIKPYSKSPDVSLRGQSKPYLADTGLLTKISNIGQAQAFENLVYRLVKSRGEVFYYQSKGGAEIDFIVKNGNDTTAFEVKTRVQPTDLAKLQRAIKPLGMDKYFIVTMHYSPLPHTIYPFQL